MVKDTSKKKLMLYVLEAKYNLKYCSKEFYWNKAGVTKPAPIMTE